MNETQTINNFDENDFLMSCFGRNENNEPNCSISCTLHKFVGVSMEDAANELNYREIVSRETNGGELYFEVHNDYVQLDMIFKSYIDPELQLIWNVLKQYGEMLHISSTENSGEIPVLNFAVSPEKYRYSHYLTFGNPLFWVLQPSDFEIGECNMIRILFPTDTFEISEILPQMRRELNRDKAAINRQYSVVVNETEVK